jgi:hypothetical protein
MNVQNMSFSAHADSKGIVQLIKHLQPRNVMFVHGEAHKMKQLGKTITEVMGIPVYCPENFQLTRIEGLKPVPPTVSIYLPVGSHFDHYSQSINGYLITSPHTPNIIFVKSMDRLTSESMAIIRQILGEKTSKQIIAINRYIISDPNKGITIEQSLARIKDKSIKTIGES